MRKTEDIQGRMIRTFDTPARREPGTISVEYPQEAEEVTSRAYAFRITLRPGEEARRVEISLDGTEWRRCRPAVGYWWHYWQNYRPGRHTAVARLWTKDGKLSISPVRRFKVNRAARY